MHLESLTIKNYRKFRSTDNTVCFVKPKVIAISTEEKQTKSVIAPSTTLIIGKNNAGKTTVVNALRMLCHNEQPSASDFNLSYLNELFVQYKQAFEADSSTNFECLETPNLEFNLMVKVNFSDEDLMTHLASFMSISEVDNGEPVNVRIVIKVVLAEEPKFKEKVNEVFSATDTNGNKLGNKQQFEKFYSLLSKVSGVSKTDGNIYQIVFMDHLGYPTEKFSLKKLINIKEIKANRKLEESVLRDVFNKIVAYQFSNDDISRSSLEKSIESINNLIFDNVGAKSADISQVLSEMESTEKIDLNLSGNVTYDAIMKGLIKYNFMDGDDYIPGDQFGLGYINLLNIIGEIIHFVDSYEDKSHYSQINLLFIEEPETFMHPHMQEFFIKHIDKAVTKALEIANTSSKGTKILQCQIAITTHSSHIVNSKIHSSNTFNNLNYLTSINKCTKAINLTDEAVVSNEDPDASNKLNFIKKHIKYKVSELFFSDAIIFVEGITEETLLNYYLETHPQLSNYYISVFNINGAHGKLYLPLAKKLSVPSLIVTDLDIKREKCENNKKHDERESCEVCGQRAKDGVAHYVPGVEPSFAQITKLDARRTTNTTLKEFNQHLRSKIPDEADKLDDIEFFKDDNLYVVFQKDPINGQHATSLEEALILTNYQNDAINAVLNECKPRIYQEILREHGGESRENLIRHSYKLQKKLSDSKSDFSNKLLFSLLSAKDGDVIPQLPNYLQDGLAWLALTLQTINTPPSSEAKVAVDIETESTETAADDSE
ncbi:AAA family ATPase [Methylophaga sp.]|uniref:AAA family ATPase n=1 Tax=Methylophaga sp. TaxID=2024840 RepID=UPI003A8CA815